MREFLMKYINEYSILKVKILASYFELTIIYLFIYFYYFIII